MKAETLENESLRERALTSTAAISREEKVYSRAEAECRQKNRSALSATIGGGVVVGFVLLGLAATGEQAAECFTMVSNMLYFVGESVVSAGSITGGLLQNLPNAIGYGVVGRLFQRPSNVIVNSIAAAAAGAGAPAAEDPLPLVPR